ncbi:hypothetical protein IWX49DRAFT_595466 [Phyllosticta citricarpa]
MPREKPYKVVTNPTKSSKDKTASSSSYSSTTSKHRRSHRSSNTTTPSPGAADNNNHLPANRYIFIPSNSNQSAASPAAPAPYPPPLQFSTISAVQVAPISISLPRPSLQFSTISAIQVVPVDPIPMGARPPLGDAFATSLEHMEAHRRRACVWRGTALVAAMAEWEKRNARRGQEGKPSDWFTAALDMVMDEAAKGQQQQ